jgi:enamine deaminase RidA (YjgF/YER057c/UK114 family)
MASLPGEGRTIYITGQVAWDKQGILIGGEDCEKQLQRCFENVENILAAVGWTLADIVSLTIFFLDPKGLPVIQKVRATQIHT